MSATWAVTVPYTYRQNDKAGKGYKNTELNERKTIRTLFTTAVSEKQAHLWADKAREQGYTDVDVLPLDEWHKDQKKRKEIKKNEELKKEENKAAAEAV